MALLDPILSKIPEVFTGKESHHCPKIWSIKRLTSFSPNPTQMNCCRSSSQSTNQGTHSLNITSPIPLCTMPYQVVAHESMNPLSSASLSPPTYDTNYYILHCLYDGAVLRRTIICTKSIHLSYISTYTNTVFLPTHNLHIEFFSFLIFPPVSFWAKLPTFK
jgi:hypothetical protein